jgi:hypothetical protein
VIETCLIACAVAGVLVPVAAGVDDPDAPADFDDVDELEELHAPSTSAPVAAMSARDTNRVL